MTCIPGDFRVPLGAPGRTSPAHLWKSCTRNITGTPLALEGGEVLATGNRPGKGETVRVPSFIALGARRTDKEAFSNFLRGELGRSVDSLPVMFKIHQKGLLMRTMRSDRSLITILVNKSGAPRTVGLEVKKG